MFTQVFVAKIEQKKKDAVDAKAKEAKRRKQAKNVNAQRIREQLGGSGGWLEIGAFAKLGIRISRRRSRPKMDGPSVDAQGPAGLKQVNPLGSHSAQGRLIPTLRPRGSPHPQLMP